MAVQRDSITVVPPDGETVVVDILEDDVSLGTVHADRSKTRMLTLPLTITARTSFYVPVGSGPYDVSVKLGDDEIAGADGTPVTVSRFPAEIHAKIDAAELAAVSSAAPVHKTSAYTAASGDAVLADASGADFNVTLPAPTSGAKVGVKNVGASGTVTVLPHASENIDGEASRALPTPQESLCFVSDGTDWWIF